MKVWLLAQPGGRAYSGLILLVEGVLVVGGLLLFWAVYRRFLQEKIRWENAAAFQRPPEKLARSLESWDVVFFQRAFRLVYVPLPHLIMKIKVIFSGAPPGKCFTVIATPSEVTP